jgi:hypothetical protein
MPLNTGLSANTPKDVLSDVFCALEYSETRITTAVYKLQQYVNDLIQGLPCSPEWELKR